MHAHVGCITLVAALALAQTTFALDVEWAPIASKSNYLLEVPNPYNGDGIEHSWADTSFRDPGQRDLAAFRDEMMQSGRYGGGMNWDSLPVGTEVASSAGVPLDIRGLPFDVRIHSTTNGKPIKVIEWELPPANPTASGAVSGSRFLAALDARDPREWKLEFDLPAGYALRGFGVVLANSGWDNDYGIITFYDGETPIAAFDWADGVWFPDHSTDDNFIGYWSSEPITAVHIVADEGMLLGRLDDVGLIFVPEPNRAMAQVIYPQDGDANTPQDVTLMWSAAQRAAEHAIYFGEDKDAVAKATPTSTGIYKGFQALDKTALDPGALAWNKTYYWRIDEVNDASTDSPWKGSVWSFTTADFVVVDDFESYTNEEGRRIYETWVDGWINKTGSQVGNLGTPFAERTIVHGGKQSMPLDYNNVNSPFYSEAEREFSPVQDWTVNDANTLVLDVRGRTANAATALYVAVEDASRHAAVVAYPDATAATTAKWTEWKIPLSEFASVNVAKIKKMYIGLGDRKAPVAGGAGRLYIDDIRVTKP
jgi:hypothetical protein